MKITSEVADLADHDLGTERWDAIVSIWCHLPPTLRADVHQRVVRALRPGGIFILEAYTPRQLEYKTGGPPVAEIVIAIYRKASDIADYPLSFNVLRVGMRRDDRYLSTWSDDS